jgi:Protein of unknown function with HXXEE motif
MDKRIRVAFLALVLLQGLHSMEESIGRLWEIFTPARLLSSLVSKNPEVGFLEINTGLLLFGFWCWRYPLRKNSGYASALICCWIVIELINGIGHPVWAIYKGSYVPGLATAPLLLFVAIYLSKQLFFLLTAIRKRKLNSTYRYGHCHRPIANLLATIFLLPLFLQPGYNIRSDQ